MNENLYLARHHAGLSVGAAADALGITRQTFRLWESGKLRTPVYALELLQYRAGYLPDPAWSGWRFSKGLLWAPTGDAYRPGDFYSIIYLRAALESTTAELLRLRPPPEPVQLSLPLPHIPAWERYKHLKRG